MNWKDNWVRTFTWVTCVCPVFRLDEPSFEIQSMEAFVFGRILIGNMFSLVFTSFKFHVIKCECPLFLWWHCGGIKSCLTEDVNGACSHKIFRFMQLYLQQWCRPFHPINSASSKLKYWHIYIWFSEIFEFLHSLFLFKIKMLRCRQYVYLKKWPVPKMQKFCKCPKFM